ncbi:MAG: pseudaminic acid cytidylyltransferase [Rhizobiaceae bacterium]
MQEKPVCIIPARGGSKRIPRKNIADFNGKPLISWSIGSALESSVFSKVLVSTEDAEISEIAKANGAEIPFVRNSELADDHATTADVLKDALQRIPECMHACCLYPTAPMITAKILQKAYEKIVDTEADCVVSVTEFDFHPLRAFRRDDSDRLAFHWPEHALTRSQDLPEMVHDAGAFYFFNVKRFIESGKLISKNTIGFQLSRMQAVDIDTPEDFEFAKVLHRLGQGKFSELNG